MKINSQVKESLNKKVEFDKANSQLVSSLNQASRELTYARAEYFTKGQTQELKEKMDMALKNWEAIDNKYQELLKNFN